MITVLVADDHKNLRKLMALHLSQAGYRVLEAEDGRQALEMFDKEPIHLLIADIMMPHIDGYELTRQLRGAGYNMPILMITAKETIQDKQTGFDTGADDYMVKPVDMTEMLLRVRALLRRSHINSERQLTVGSTILNEESLTVTTPDAIFICYAPAEKPEIAIAVVVEKGARGAELAPVAKQVLDYYFSFQKSTQQTETELTLLR